MIINESIYAKIIKIDKEIKRKGGRMLKIDKFIWCFYNRKKEG